MRIIISPAKQMRTDTDASAGLTMPVFLEKTEILTRWIRSLSYEEQKKLWACNDKIARQNNERFAHMDLRRNLTPRRYLRTASTNTCRNICGSCPDSMAS